MSNLLHPDLDNLPLFDWAVRRRSQDAQQLPYAARWLKRHHHVPPGRALLLAGLCGFSVGA